MVLDRNNCVEIAGLNLYISDISILDQLLIQILDHLQLMKKENQETVFYSMNFPPILIAEQ